MRNWSLLAVLALALGVRLIWVLLVPNAQYSDSVWYDGAAANLAARGVYGLDGPSAWFPPGYPFLLAALYTVVGHTQFAGKLANVAIGVALTGFTYLLARRVQGHIVGVLSAALIALWPNLVFHTGILSSDLLAAAGFAAAMWFGMRTGYARRGALAPGLLLGALIGWMVLVRPVSLILLASLFGWWLISTRSLRCALTWLAPVVLVLSLVVGSWTVRNYLQFGEVITIATNGGYNFWQTNHRYADGNDTFWPFVPMSDPEYQIMFQGDEFTKNREGYRYALAYLRTHPQHLLTMFPTKLFWLYHTDTSGFYEGVLDAPMEQPSPVAAWIGDHARLVEALTFRYYEAVVALAAVGALAALVRGPRDWIWPLLALPLLLSLFHGFFHAKDRFHIPLDGVFALFAAVAIDQCVHLTSRAAASARQRLMAVAPG